jgi:hypothetical protein
MPADEQELRFLELDGARVAYATLGSGPALLVPALWIRYDRLGTGLSDRTIDPAEFGAVSLLLTTRSVAGALQRPAAVPGNRPMPPARDWGP